jgi:hypothetical protein
MNLAGNIYGEMRMNRTIEYLRSVANGEAEAEDESEDDAPEPQAASDEPSEEGMVVEEETSPSDEIVGDEETIESEPAEQLEAESLESEPEAGEQDEESAD